MIISFHFFFFDKLPLVLFLEIRQMFKLLPLEELYNIQKKTLL